LQWPRKNISALKNFSALRVTSLTEGGNIAPMANLLQDIRYCYRAAVKSPGFTLVALLTLALGIGANSSIFSIVNAVLLRPLPYKDAQQLVTISNDFTGLGTRHLGVSAPEFLDYREQSQVFENVVAVNPGMSNLTGVDQPERVESLMVSPSYFLMLGVEPELGRCFRPDDERPGIGEITVISYNMWQRRFGGDLSVIGKTLRLDDDLFTVVGVLPRAFQPPSIESATEIDLWVPAGFREKPFPTPSRTDRQLLHYTIARLKQGVSLKQGQAEMDAIASRLQREYPDQYQETAGWKIALTPLQDEVVGNVGPSLLILLGAVGFVLLIACANVASLTLVRATARRKEVAIRMALGATRARLMRQFFTETVLLSMVGGALGLLLAFYGVKILVGLSPVSIPRLGEIGADGRVVFFTLLTSIFAGVIFGLAPAFAVSKADLNETIKEGGRGGIADPRGNRMRRLLIAFELALAFVLLIGAGLLIRSFWQMQKVAPGFDPRNVLTMGMWLPYPNNPEAGKYFLPAQRIAFYEQALRRAESLPTVQSAGLVSIIPLNGEKEDRLFTVEGQDVRSPDDLAHAEARVVSSNYFQTLGITLLTGRHFTEQDDAKSPRVAIVNETLARRFWPDDSPLGKRIKFGPQQSPAPWLSIVGVIHDIKSMGLDAATPSEIYLPYFQFPLQSAYLVVKSPSSVSSMAELLQSEVRKVDADQPIYNARSLEEIMSIATGPRRFSMMLLTIFAVAALALAAIGIYGVVSYSVSHRTQEIGIRMAMGAQHRQVINLIVAQAMALVIGGLAVGFSAALILTRFLADFLFGIKPFDPLTFIIISAVLMAVALVASYIPARRAARVDPVVALRCE
jgi:putative ABC transport system permease protein